MEYAEFATLREDFKYFSFYDIFSIRKSSHFFLISIFDVFPKWYNFVPDDEEEISKQGAGRGGVDLRLALRPLPHSPLPPHGQVWLRRRQWEVPHHRQQ